MQHTFFPSPGSPSSGISPPGVALASGEHSPGLEELSRLLWRHRWLIAGLTGSVILLAALVLSRLTPLYTAQTQIRLNPAAAQVIDVRQVLPSPALDPPAAVPGEVEVLRSPALAALVVERENLMADDEFNPTLSPPSLFRQLADTAGLTAEGSTDGLTPREATIEQFREAVTVNALNRSLVISLQVSSRDPARAARLSEALAEVYLSRQVLLKQQATRDASQWLAGHLDRLREQVNASEAAVADWRREHHLGQAMDPSLVAQQRTELNSQLVIARAGLADSEARLRQVRSAIASGALDSTREVLSSPLIQSLREQEAELHRRLADLSSRYGDKHPKMQEARAEAEGLQERLRAESRKVAQALEGEVRATASRVASLEQTLAGLDESRDSQGMDSIHLRELERDAEASRALYLTFLARYKETTSQEGLHEANGSILSHASLPQRPSWPRKGLTLLASGLAGLMLSVVVVALRHHLDRCLRHPDEVERMLAHPCIGQTPVGRVDPLLLGGQVEEDMRSLRTSLTLLAGGVLPQVVMVTSSLPGEGKSTLCLWLASVSASARLVTAPAFPLEDERQEPSGLAMEASDPVEAREEVPEEVRIPGETPDPETAPLPARLPVCLIEADLRRPGLGNSIPDISPGTSPGISREDSTIQDTLPSPSDAVPSGRTGEAGQPHRPGLPEYLSGEACLEEILQTSGIPGLSIITARPIGGAAGNILATPAFGELIRQLRQRFSLIVIDSPPVLPVVDARLLAPCADAVLYAVRWEHTPYPIARQGLSVLQGFYPPVTGVVLTRVDSAKLHSYGYGGSGHYGSAYYSYYDQATAGREKQ